MKVYTIDHMQLKAWYFIMLYFTHMVVSSTNYIRKGVQTGGTQKLAIIFIFT